MRNNDPQYLKWFNTLSEEEKQRERYYSALIEYHQRERKEAAAKERTERRWGLGGYMIGGTEKA